MVVQVSEEAGRGGRRQLVSDNVVLVCAGGRGSMGKLCLPGGTGGGSLLYISGPGDVAARP